jgi:hypothetical protein
MMKRIRSVLFLVPQRFVFALVGSDMKACSRIALGIVSVLCFTAPEGRAAQTSFVINVPAYSSGSYNVYGDCDPRRVAGLTGVGALGHVHGPSHSFIVFQIPQFAGTLTNVILLGSSYMASYNNFEGLEFYSVTTPASTVRDGGFGKTNIYNDLGAGTPYGGAGLAGGYNYIAAQLTPGAVADIQAARGTDFVMGGAMDPSYVPPNYNGFSIFPDYASYNATLQLEILGPSAPTIHTQPPAQNPSWPSNSPTLLSVGASGAGPLSYYWFVAGVNQGEQSWPQFYFYSDNTNPTPVFVVVSNSFGTATSAVVQVKAEPATFQPNFTNLAVRVGDTVDFQPRALVQTYPVSWTWKKNGVPILNDNFYFLHLENVQTNDSGDYTLTITNELGVSTSPVMRLTVLETPPSFLEAPFDVLAPLGSPVALPSTALGGPPPTYQWYFNGSAISGATNGSLQLYDISNSETGRYFVVASNTFGKLTSDVATVRTYLDPPVFTQQPVDTTVYPSNFAYFYCSAAATPYPSFQWYFNSVAIPGATYQSLSVIGTSNTAGTYYCVASNASGTATSSNATLTVLYVPPVLYGPFGITNALAGFDYQLAAYLQNPWPETSFQWQFNETDIPGATLYYLPLPNIETNHAGNYRVIATNPFGVTTSAVASVTVTTQPPSFISQPINQDVVEGTTIYITASVAGAPPPQVSLFHNGANTGLVPINNVFALIDSTLADTGDYSIVASNRYGTATSELFRINVRRAGPLDHWTQRNPIPQGEDLFGITRGQNKFVAVGDHGAIINSTDGTNWNVRSFRTRSALQAVTYGNGRFVAVGDDGIILTSTNGDNWAAQQTPDDDTLRGVAFGAEKFLAVGRNASGPIAYSSTNGVNWSALPATDFVANLDAVTFGSGAFVIADDFGFLYRSTDLVSWTSYATGISDPEGAAFVNNRFFATGNNGRFATSSDGTTWTTITNGATTRRLFGTAYGAGRYIMVGAKGAIISATDVMPWSAVTSPTADRIEDVIFANGLFVAVGENGTILTSSSGESGSWAIQTRGATSDLDGLAVANGLAVAVGKNNTILTSTNGTDWVRRVTPESEASSGWHGVGYGDGKWIVVGTSPNILVSTDGVNWETRPLGFLSNYLKSIVYANGLWVAAGVIGGVVTSVDAVTWTPVDLGYSYDLNEVTYGNGTFLIVGDHGANPAATIFTSTNGTTWANRTYFNGKNARGIAFANGKFVMCQNDGLILYATNSPATNVLVWNYATTPEAFHDGANLRGVTWSNSIWVAVGNDGRLLTSTNAAFWRKRVTPTSVNLHAVRFINNTFVAVGNGGMIIQSAPLTPQLLAQREGPNLRLTFSSPYEGVFKLQDTSDFTWHDLSLITNAIGTVDFVVPLPPGSGEKFFRVIAP